MNNVAKRYQEKLPGIKERIRDSHDYFRENYNRYNEFRRFVFESSLTSAEIQLLASMGRPQLEFNILEAYVSRLLGEFSKQEPDILVHSYDEEADPVLVDFIQQHLHYVLSDHDNSHLRYEVYKDLLSGGFSAVKVFTEYEHSMSMKQVIRFQRCEPTLVGFDKTAKESHKGDGQYCFELFPKTESEFKEEFPDVDIKSLTFAHSFEGFNWTYISGKEKVILVVDYYEKKKKEEWIVEVLGLGVMTKKKYEEIVSNWDKIELPPPIVGKPRKTTVQRIERYRIVENTVIEHEETDYDMLPIVFIDGHSVMIKNINDTNIRQVTRPYVYHARGAQRLKNYAGISLANEIENTVQHKFMVAKEALPKEEDLLDAYKNVQQASVLTYNSIYEKDPDKPIPNPIREVQRVPAPPEITQAFVGTDSLMQNILGSYDASLGINNNQLSGVAIVEAATQSNATAMPYIVGCLQGFQRLAQIYVSLMPKYYVTPKSLPIIDIDGRRQWVKVNQEGGIELSYHSDSFNISVTAGASFQVQKSRTIGMVKEVMQMSPLFAQFMSEKGLQFILENMEGKGIEDLKQMTKEWTEELEKQRQQQSQQPSPEQMKTEVEMAKLEHEQQKSQQDFAIEVAKLNQDNEELMARMALGRQSAQVELMKAMSQNLKVEKELAIKAGDVSQKHRHNVAKLMHDVLKNGVKNEKNPV